MLKDDFSIDTSHLATPHAELNVDISKVDSPALARIVAEIRNNDIQSTRSYDRAHNRHNR